MRRLIALLMLSIPAMAQAPADPTTATEKMALTLIQTEMKQAQEARKKFEADFAAFQADYAKAHPGWRFDSEKGPVKDEPGHDKKQ